MFTDSASFRRSMTMTAATLTSALGLLMVIGCSDDGLGQALSGLRQGHLQERTGRQRFNRVLPPVAKMPRLAAPRALSRMATTLFRHSVATMEPFRAIIKSPSLPAKPICRRPRPTRKKPAVLSGRTTSPRLTRTPRCSIPRKYESPDAGLKAKVEAHSNTIDFDLTD